MRTLMRSIASFAFVLMLSTASYAQDAVFHTSMVAAIAAHGADLATTEYCLGQGKCYEMNPLLARFEQPATFGAVKMGVAAGQLWLVSYLRGKLPANQRWLATVGNFAVAGIFAGVAAHNAALIRQ